MYTTPLFFFFNDTATTEIYTLSLHDALPICERRRSAACAGGRKLGLPNDLQSRGQAVSNTGLLKERARSEEHTSELQSRQYLVCRLLLEKKKKRIVRKTRSVL